MASNVAVGILRPPHVFFYEVDVKRGHFRAMKIDLKKMLRAYLNYWSLYRTKHGYHVIGNCGNEIFRKWLFDYFSQIYPSDFTKKLKTRWNKRNPQVLRISEKWDLKTGKVVSPKPKFICGNFFLEGIMDYKVLYYAK